MSRRSPDTPGGTERGRPPRECSPDAPFYAAYAGPSMHPTLREPELLEILPCGDRPLRAGDIALFLAEPTGRPTVHRVVRATPAGVCTRGDNNSSEDPCLVQPQDIQGRVVAAWRGQRRRTIAGGLRGRLAGRWLRCRRLLRRGASSLGLVLFRPLSSPGSLARLLPVTLRPKVVVFHAGGREQLRLLLGRRLIGHYDARGGQWRILRPFHLFVSGALLPGGASQAPGRSSPRVPGRP